MSRPIASGDVVILPGSQHPHITINHRVEPHLPSLKRRPVLHHPLLFSLICTLALLSPRMSAAAKYEAKDIISATNAVRVQHFLPALSVHDALTAAAEAKARDMLMNQYFDHTSPNGESYWSWFTPAGYRFTAAGENLAKDFADITDVIQAWLKSAGHRQNILSSVYRDIGVAVVDGQLGGKQSILIVEFFGSRFSPAAVSATTAMPLKPTSVISTPQPLANHVTVRPTENPPVILPVNDPLPGSTIATVVHLQPQVLGATTSLIHTPVFKPSSRAIGSLPLLIMGTLSCYLFIISLAWKVEVFPTVMTVRAIESGVNKELSTA